MERFEVGVELASECATKCLNKENNKETKKCKGYTWNTGGKNECWLWSGDSKSFLIHPINDGRKSAKCTQE